MAEGAAGEAGEAAAGVAFEVPRVVDLAAGLLVRVAPSILGSFPVGTFNPAEVGPV